MSISFAATTNVPADIAALGVPVYSGDRQLPASPVELDVAFLEACGFEGKVGQAQAVLAEDGSIIVAVGMGEPEAVTADILRRAAAAFVKSAWRSAVTATNLVDAAPSNLDKAAAAQAVVEGIALAAYRFSTYKTESEPCLIESCVLVGAEQADLAAGAARGATVVEAVILARDLVNEPAGDMTPTRLAQIATETAERTGLNVSVWDEPTIVAERLGGLLGVARGSDEAPRLVQLVYEPSGESRGTIALVGKGITFDSGGLSLKTADGMMTMKTDMSGAAAVLATMSVLPALAPDVKVVGILPVTENMPGGRAIKPGDVLKIRNGKTVEVLNTDAEGRLVLADGLSLAVESRPDAVVDIATLTGAVSVALGKKVAGMMGTSQPLVDQIRDASGKTGELFWQLPLPEEYRCQIDSEIADIKNIGTPAAGAGTITAALFLREFVGDVPWAHLDIAGTARSDTEEHYLPKGGTGFGVRTLIELVSAFEKPVQG